MAPGTRSTNASAHPGAPDAKSTRRSSAQVKQEKDAKSNKQKELAANQALVQKQIAHLENQLGITQMRKNLEAANPPSTSLMKVQRPKAKDLKEVQEDHNTEDAPVIELTADEQEAYVRRLENLF
jgi:hypothetical protein